MAKNGVSLFLGQLCGSELHGQSISVQRLNMDIMVPLLHHTLLVHSVAARRCRWDGLTLAYFRNGSNPISLAFVIVLGWSR